MLCCKKRQPPILLFLGLDGSGKTSIIKRMQGGDVRTTWGFSVARVNIDRKCIVYDVGGGDRIRGIWSGYFAEAFAIVWVVDVSSTERFDKVREEMHKVLQDSNILGKPVLILGNKQDLKGVSDEELSKELGAEGYKVIGCCAKPFSSKFMLDPRIREGLQWLCTQIDKQMPYLYFRIEDAMAYQREAFKKEREEKKRNGVITSKE